MNDKPIVAVIGAGPAGIYAAKELADQGAQVLLINRDIKPGGLAEYGIFFDKYKMKGGLRKQFRKVLANENISYFGNVTIGESGDMTFAQIREMGVDAVLVTVGAQGTKWLGTPGEGLNGVYHAKDLVYHMNDLPPYAEQEFQIGKRAAVIGAGNVMMDIASWLIRYRKLEEVIIIVRRDPSAVKFTKKEMQILFNNLDQDVLKAEIERTRPIMEAVGGDADAALAFIMSAEKRAKEATSDSLFRFEFLSVTKEILGDADGNVIGIELEDTTLKLRDNGSTSARGLGTTRVVDVDTVVFAIGDTVDTQFGLPIEWGSEFAKHPDPRFPMDGLSHEAYDPEKKAAVEGVFLAGWAREASSGLVGIARKDGINGATALLKYVSERDLGSADYATLCEQLAAVSADVVTKAQWQKLDALEEEKAAADGLPVFKYSSNEQMLEIIRK